MAQRLANSGQKSQDRSNAVRERRRIVEQLIQKLPTELSTRQTSLVRGASETWWLRTVKGKQLAVFHDKVLADFIATAVSNLKIFMGYIEHLEREAFENRRRYRQQNRLVRELADELLAARDAGVETKVGQFRVRAAIDALYDARNRADEEAWDDDWRDVRDSFRT